jgi:hypothetical protein
LAHSPARSRWALPCSCFAALILLGSLSLIPLYLTSRKRLSVVGTYTADASTWVRSYDGYYWETNEAQIFFTESASRTILRLDDRSKLVTSAVAVSAQQALAQSIEAPRPSPDGKWLLVRQRSPMGFTAVETSARRVIQWKSTRNSLLYALWMPDSRHWVEFAQSASGKSIQPIIHALDGPDRKTAEISDSFIWPIGTTWNAHVLNARNEAHVELWEYDLEGNLKAPQKHRVALPDHTAVSEVEGSPDGSRVAYLVQEEPSSLIRRLLSRMMPVRSNSTNISLWVSRTDGSGLRQIGFETIKEAGGVQWSPDSKRLSLFLDKGFYIVPAD